MSSSHNHYHWDFGYDNLNRLLSANYGYGSSSGSSYFDVTGLSYDDASNITGLQRDDETGSLIDNLTYNYSGSNRLQSVSDAVSTTSEPRDAEDASFGYDANGNLTSQSGKLTDVAYDHRNLPVHFYLDGGNELIANYNADGQRILKELAGGSWQFYVMDGQQTLAVIKDGNLSHINLVGNSTFGRWEPGGARRYYVTDHLGSTRAVVDNNGNVLETFDYYPFGLLMPKHNTAGANTIEKFTGKERDEEGGLNLDYFGARYYDPALGRWLSVDPKADDLPSWSSYSYTLNNPVNFFDPDGLFPIQIHVRSFAPYKTFGFGQWYGDNRSFSTSAKASSRIRQTTYYETDSRTGITAASGNYSVSKYGAIAYSEAYINGSRNPVQTNGRTINTYLSGNNDAIIKGIDGFPCCDIDVKSNLNIDVTDGENGNQILSITGSISGDGFPNAEAFVNDADGNSLFLGTFSEKQGPNYGPFIQLAGDGNVPMIDNINISITVNDKGIFTGVKQGDKTYTIDEWNERFE